MEPVATTRGGTVRGANAGGVARFLGIPYAAPPFGANRFQAPAPAPPWEGVRDALTYGPTAPKPGYPPPFDALLPEPAIPGEGCLNLNIWTPGPEGSGMPVMVWIHGGAFRNGSSAVETYDGTAFARDGIVCVTLNYRLGVDGFGHLPGVPPNRGLLDQIVALEWVRDNIAGFGGDPNNVTVFGESAGGMSVVTLLSMGLGLFRRAIAQSGSAQPVQAPEDAARITAAVAARLGVEPSAEAFAGLAVDRFVAAQAAVAADLTADPDPARWGPSTIGAGVPFGPVPDGEILTRAPIEAISAGVGADVPLLIGTTTEEFRFYLAPTGVTRAATAADVAGHLISRGYDPAIADVYAAARPGASPGDVLAAIITDTFFRVPSHRVTEARRDARTYVYEFAWRTPVQDLGACHALELGFVFGTLGDAPMEGANPPVELGEAMHRAWAAFATHGDPGWARHDASRPVMRFDAGGGELVHDPHGDERRCWDGVL